MPDLCLYPILLNIGRIEMEKDTLDTEKSIETFCAAVMNMICLIIWRRLIALEIQY